MGRFNAKEPVFRSSITVPFHSIVIIPIASTDMPFVFQEATTDFQQ